MGQLCHCARFALRLISKQEVPKSKIKESKSFKSTEVKVKGFTNEKLGVVLLCVVVTKMNNQWAQAIDPVSGRAYYFNQSTGETSWSPPVHLPPPSHHFSPPPPQHDAQHQHRIVIGQAAVHSATPTAAPLQYQQQQQQQHQQQQQTQQLTASQNANNAALYSSVTYQLDPTTATTPGLLVPTIRATIDKEQAQTTSIPKIELEGVSAGTIADLCNISREWRSRNLHVDGGDFATNEVPRTDANNEATNHYYKPLQPFSLPLQSRPPHVEPGRVDIRMHALYSKLRSLAEENFE